MNDYENNYCSVCTSLRNDDRTTTVPTFSSGTVETTKDPVSDDGNKQVDEKSGKDSDTKPSIKLDSIGQITDNPKCDNNYYHGYKEMCISSGMCDFSFLNCFLIIFFKFSV